MSNFREIVITDDVGGEVTLTPSNNVPVEIANSNGEPVGVQYPFPTNGDSVYCKDVWAEQSITTDWLDTDATGEEIACIPFTNLHTRITNSTATNPKILLIHMNRSTFASQIGLGCVGGDDFSNVTIKLLGSGGTERTVVDDSANSTKYTSRVYKFTNQLFNAVQLEFATVDPVCLSNVTIQKITGVSVDQVEPTTNSLQVMQYSHAELHSGDRYLWRQYAPVPKAGVVEYLLVTPDTARWAHMTTAIDNAASVVVAEFFEAPTVSNNGTLQTARNRNRNFPDNNTTNVYINPIVLTDGDSMGDLWLGAGKNLPGGTARDAEEILLRQNTLYLLRITEQNVAATTINVAFDWYEHTNLGG